MVDPALNVGVNLFEGRLSDITNIAVGSKVITQKLNAEESKQIMNNFKQKALISALAGAGALAMAGAANAVYVNPDGLGQALVYPYYTVRAGNVTLLSVVNTTTQAKAVKVRFLEGKNSQEVLDFNLFLSAKDVWTGVISPTADGAQVATLDKSCTNPSLFSDAARTVARPAAFRNFLFSSDAPALQTLDRTREGYVEMIEMATIDNLSPLGKDVTHVAGVPACKLTADTSFLSASGLTVPSGGIFGNGTILNALGGASTGYDAVAIDGFGWQRPPITFSGSTAPTLSGVPGVGGTSKTSVVTNGGNLYITNWSNTINAVSATMMHDNVYGEYAYTTDGVIGTDWIVTMPTKNQYVNFASTPVPPFQNIWDKTNGVSCDDVALNSTDREEFIGITNDDFSPRPPAAKGNSLCYEANVISFGGVSASGASLVTGSLNDVGIKPVQNQGLDVAVAGKEGGWLALSFTNPGAFIAGTGEIINTSLSTGATTTGVGTPLTYFGLPVVGFAMSGAAFKTGNPQQNYSNSYSLKFSRKIQ